MALAGSGCQVALAIDRDRGAVRVWDLLTGERFVLQSVQPYVNCLEFHPDGAVLATGGQDGRVALLSVKDRLVVRTLPGGHSKAVIRLAFAPHGKLLASAGRDGKARTSGTSMRPSGNRLFGGSAPGFHR